MSGQAERIRFQLNQGALEAADQALEKIFQQPEIAAEFWQLKSRLMDLQGELSEASTVLEEALSCFPDRAELHQELAHLYLRQERYLSAGEHLQAARAFAPESLRHTRELAEYFLLLGQRRNALLYLQEALHLAENPESLYPLLGQILLLFGRYGDAEAAWLQSLESGHSIVPVQLSLLRLHLSQRQFGKALSCSLNLRACSNLFKYQRELWSEACFLWGWNAYWQGDLSTARELWRESLAAQISAEAFYALTIALPLVYQDAEERDNWQVVLEDGLKVLLNSHLPPPGIPKMLELSAVHLPQLNSVFFRQARTQWLQQFYTETRPVSLSAKKMFRLGFFAPDLNNLEIQAYLQVLKQAIAPEGLELSLYYLQPDLLPDVLQSWEQDSFQVPAHTLALETYFAGQPVDAMAFLGFSPELYLLAFQRAAAVQILMPTLSQSSGLPSMDFVLCESNTETWFEAYTEQPLPVPTSIQLVCPLPLLEPGMRKKWNLPRLGHLYLIPAEPQYWTLETDAMIARILQQDRKAFILGLQIPGSALHTRVMQRHERSLADRHHRMRWLQLSSEQWPELLSLIDLVIDPLEYGAPWACCQALLQGVPVLTCPSKNVSSRMTRQLLEEMNLPELIVTQPEDLAERACKILKEKREHVILKERVEAERERLLRVQPERATVILKSIYQRLIKLSQHE